MLISTQHKLARHMNHSDTGATPELFGNMAKSEETAAFQASLEKANQELARLEGSADELARATVLLAKVNALLGLEQKQECWQHARPIFDVFIRNDCWEHAVDSCNVLYQAEHPESLAALVQGVWLSVTFPIDPELTVLMLDHLIEAMPPKTEGPALAAATAHYIVSIRASDEAFENLNFLTTNLLAKAARDYGNVESQALLDFWIESHELNDPAAFLPRLGKLLTAILEEENWWIDREIIRAKLPQ